MAMSVEHKAALAEGRKQSKMIKEYLVALETPEDPKPKFSQEQLDGMAVAVKREEKPLVKLDLIQALIDAKASSVVSEPVDLPSLEWGFVQVAAVYSERKGISYAAWRQAGVPVDTLKAANISK